MTRQGVNNEEMCNCNVPAALRTVGEGSSSTGRPYYTCGNSGGCSFWKFADAPLGSGSGASGSSTVPAKRPYSKRKDSAHAPAARMCKCGEEASQRTVTKEGGNQGRKFWVCPTRDTGCGFFEWDDEPPRITTGVPREGVAGGMPRTLSNNTAGGSQSSDQCFKCGQVGHWSTNCPNPEGGTNKRARSFGTMANSSNPSLTCFTCKEPGHISPDCPNSGGSRPKASSGGGGGGQGQCFKCNQEGHWSKDCKNEGGGPSRSSSSGGTRGKRGGRGGGAPKSKRGRGGKKKSAFAAADGR
ncbi:hypothetical protein BDQ12DRAFT_672441 [Crucibulum laeve]|uniref:Uncharacterized protein n=1 Tax=Crucibulum laeve TaxID=68775 RepID=A0A5C3MFD1_9AGAR|nr:hypothetical protein BDQ12DRAFT_672441 [Crucibulum laeve]